MLIRESKDWKQFLDAADEGKLNRLLKDVARHRPAYKNADDVKVAQLWSALLELKKENERLNSKLGEIEGIFEAIYNRVKRNREEKEELLKTLEKF
ncbi:MAG: hypothetical protein HY368_01975 [Candidatus Aenigmarchaeota archaeon]|nr:hypothetical protein [Candidatus Aenigmarchaeota archaeon]